MHGNFIFRPEMIEDWAFFGVASLLLLISIYFLNKYYKMK